MRKSFLLVIIVILLIGMITGCSGKQKEQPDVNNENPINSLPVSDARGNDDPFRREMSSNPVFGQEAKWPEYIPEDIPKFDWEIDMIMADSNKIRIFFKNVTKKYLGQYIDLLKKQGFKLEYQVYTREGFPDNSKERIKNKDYDAVKATKGKYKIGIEFGPDIVTYDIDPKGFPEGTIITASPAIPPNLNKNNDSPASMNPNVVNGKWPDSLPDSIPAFTKGTVKTALSTGQDEYTLMITVTETKALDDYLELLKQNSYEKMESNMDNKDIFYNGEYEITIQKLMMSDYITMKICKK